MIVAVLSSLLGQPAPVETPPSATTQPAAEEAAVHLRRRGFSEAAIVILQRQDAELDALMRRFMPQMELLNQDLSAAIRVPAPDPERIGSILRRRAALMDEINVATTRHTIDLLSAFSPADRRIYLELIDPLPPVGFVRPMPIAPPAPPAPPRPVRQPF